MQLPNPPTGNTNEASFMRKLLMFVRAIKIKSGVGYKVRETTEGTFLDLEPSKGGGTTPPVYL